MKQLRDEVSETVRQRGLLAAGQGVVLAVSGGLDSMVLLHIMHGLAELHGWKITVAHFNHQLRGRSSNADESLVQRVAHSLGIACVPGQADVRAHAREHKLSLEMAARKLRHEFLARTARDQKVENVALAHHADDQVELFFLRLLRGSGGLGLGGMKWRSKSPADPGIQLIRPLLEQSKQRLRAYAQEHRIEFREDASNASLDFQRNRVRHELLPLIKRWYQPGLVEAVLRSMELVGAEADFALETARGWLAEHLERSGSTPGRVPAKPRQKRASGPKNPSLAATQFSNLPVAVQRWVLHLQLVELGLHSEFELIERLRGYPGRSVSVSPGPVAGEAAAVLSPARSVVRDASGRVQLLQAGRAEFRGESLELPLVGRAGEVAFANVKLQWKLQARRGVSTPARGGREYFDAEEVGSRLILRHWRPGDRFQPIGLDRAAKLQDIFTNLRIPSERRRELLVATTARGEIFWVEGVRIGERFKLRQRTKHRLQWCWQRV